MQDLENYLTPTEFFDFDKPRVKKQALEIIKNSTSKKEKSIALFYWVRDKIRYNMYAFYMLKSNFKASTTLRRRNGFCVSKAILLSTFARAVGIPARLHLADIINHKAPKKAIAHMKTNVFYFHGYSELLINDKWVKATPVFDKKTCEKAGYPLVEFNGEDDAMLAPFDSEGNKFVEYVNDRSTFHDFPYEHVEEIFNEKYDDAIEGLKAKAKEGKRLR